VRTQISAAVTSFPALANGTPTPDEPVRIRAEVR
jgi:hypothetical protein